MFILRSFLEVRFNNILGIFTGSSSRKVYAKPMNMHIKALQNTLNQYSFTYT